MPQTGILPLAFHNHIGYIMVTKWNPEAAQKNIATSLTFPNFRQ